MLRKLALLTVSLLASLLVAEAVLHMAWSPQVAADQYWGLGAFDADARAGYRHAPGYEGSMVRRGIFDVRAAINQQGLRQSDLAAQLAHERRLLVLGDSFSFGLGVVEEDALAAYLGDALNRRDVGLVNASQCGYGVEQEVALAPEWIERFRPRAVLQFLFAGNDFSDDYYRRWRNVELVGGWRMSRDRPMPWPPVDWLRAHSRLWQWWWGHEQRGGQWHWSNEFSMAAYDPANVPGLVRNTREAYERLAELCRSQGIALGVVMIPSRRAENWPEDRLLDALTADLATLDIPSLRLAPEDFTDMDFFPGDGHWNERGHRKAAARVVPFVVGLAGD